MFSGYAYFSDNGDGFVYALTHDDPTKLGEPVVVVNGVASAGGVFPFLFLVVSVVLVVGLLALLGTAIILRRRATALQARHARLRHAYAAVNGAFVSELLDRTPVQPAPPTGRPGPPEMPRCHRCSSSNSACSHRSPPTQAQQSLTVPPPPVLNPWMQDTNPVGVYPPRRPLSEPLFPAVPGAANAALVDYNTIYTPVPILASVSHIATAAVAQEKPKGLNEVAEAQQPTDAELQSNEAPPATGSPTASVVAQERSLRRRASRVSFVGTA